MRLGLATVMTALLLAIGGAAPSHAALQDRLHGALDGRMVRLEGGRLAPVRLQPRTRYVAFYFGASWCGPCRTFIPELRQWYTRVRAAGAAVEIVFVSDDAGCTAMLDYIRVARMPWPFIACRERARFAWLQRSRGAALPGLLVYDGEGRGILTSWTRGGDSRPRHALERLERLVNQRP